MATAAAPASFLQTIDGVPTAAAEGGQLDSIDPSTGRMWARIPRATSADVDAAVAAARRAAPAWRNLGATGRARLLRRMAELLDAHTAELAEAETRDNGRLHRDTLGGDLPACVEMWHYLAGAADKLHGDTVDAGPGSVTYTRREPVGVVGVVIAWNAPLTLFTAKVAAALAAGNTVVVKPAEQASCSVLAAGALFAEAGFPPGVVNVVSGLGGEAGDALVRHPGLGRITFTGSAPTARAISAAAAEPLTPLAFELGGKSPNIVFADADLDAAAVGVSTSSLFTGNAGQTCIAGSRILVHESVCGELLGRVEKIAAGIVLGDPFHAATSMGPIVSAPQLDRIRSYVDAGRAEGAELVFGGRSGAELFPPGSAESPLAGGYFVEPTLFLGTNDLRIAREEIFGPVGVVIPFRDDDEALAIANDSPYGLACGVWTSNLSRAHRFVRDVEAGAVWVNTYRRNHWTLPFGGVKGSGYGRDSGMESVLESTVVKSVWIELT